MTMGTATVHDRVHMLGITGPEYFGNNEARKGYIGGVWQYVCSAVVEGQKYWYRSGEMGGSYEKVPPGSIIHFSDSDVFEPEVVEGVIVDAIGMEIDAFGKGKSPIIEP